MNEFVAVIEDENCESVKKSALFATIWLSAQCRDQTQQAGQVYQDYRRLACRRSGIVQPNHALIYEKRYDE
ncbi:MAG: hypothetical protein ACI8TF_000560 [Paracoccaceae bacterium]|jgi:hypothetical protein